MKNLVLAILVFVLVSSLLDVQAQTRRRMTKQEARKEKIKENLWYGGGFNLGFSRTSIGNPPSFGNVFFIGISPMVGYRVIQNLSVGPRIELQYLTGRFGGSGGQVLRYNTFTYGGGVFMRYKFLPFLFTHFEYDYLSQEIGTDIDYARGQIITDRFGESLFLLGAGYTSGGILSTEIYLLYDVLADNNTTELPIQYRFGFTYNF